VIVVALAFVWFQQARGQSNAAVGASVRPNTAAPVQEHEERIRKIEATAVVVPMGDKEPLRLSLVQLMELYKVPALSIAVIEDYKIAWAKGYGTIGMGSNAPVTTKTLFQAGSISKPVAATGALYLVEHGKLSLDEDVNVKLKTWKVPENEFTKEQKVTLRRLMSHTGGLTVHGFPGYDVDEKVPTLEQIFNGEKPANTMPIRVDVVPGTLWRYSGGSDHRTTIDDRRNEESVSGIHARNGAGQDWHDGQQLRAAAAGLSRGPDGDWNLQRRKARAWELARVSGNGRGRTLDNADRLGPVRD